MVTNVFAIAVIVDTQHYDLGTENLAVRLLDANWQFSWSHDLDTIVLALGVIATARAAYRGHRRRKLWGFAAIVLGCLFVDESSPLHVLVDQSSLGKAVYAPLLLALVVCLWLLVDESDHRTPVAAGVAILFFSFGMHVLGTPVLRPLGYFSWLYQGAVGVKSGTEFAGLLLVVSGLWGLAGCHTQPSLARA